MECFHVCHSLSPVCCFWYDLLPADPKALLTTPSFVGFFLTIADVDTALTEIGRTLDVLEQRQLRPKKTVALLRLVGSQANKITSLVKTKEGCASELHAPRVAVCFLLSHAYLGCKLPYYNFEKMTLTRRLRVDRAAFQRLRLWLVKRRLI